MLGGWNVCGTHFHHTNIRGRSPLKRGPPRVQGVALARRGVWVGDVCMSSSHVQHVLHTFNTCILHVIITCIACHHHMHTLSVLMCVIHTWNVFYTLECVLTCSWDCLIGWWITPQHYICAPRNAQHPEKCPLNSDWINIHLCMLNIHSRDPLNTSRRDVLK